MGKKILFLLFTIGSIYACTDFLLEDKNNHFVCGRSMEFGTKLPIDISIYPRGIKYQSCLGDGKKGKSWKGRFGFLGLTLSSSNMVVDGFNEKGLSVGILWFPGAQYPKVTTKDEKKILDMTDLTCWILSKFATCDQVKRGLQKVQILFHPMEGFHGTPPIHLSVHDKEGNSIAVEFLGRKMHIIDNPQGVLTNAPKLEWHLTNLRNYVNLSAINKSAVSFNHSVLTPTGQGSGLLGIPGDWTPPSRFVKIAIYKDFVLPAPSERENVNLAFHLLNTVDIPYGAVRSKEGKDFDFTQWVVVKDLENNRMYYRTYRNLNICEWQMDLKEIKKGNSIRRVPFVYKDGSTLTK